MGYFKDRRDRGEKRICLAYRRSFPFLCPVLSSQFSLVNFSPALYYLNAWTPGNRLPSVAKGAQGRGSISLLRSRSGRRRELACLRPERLGGRLGVNERRQCWQPLRHSIACLYMSLRSLKFRFVNWVDQGLKKKLYNFLRCSNSDYKTKFWCFTHSPFPHSNCAELRL